jgi:beta-glucosidase
MTWQAYALANSNAMDGYSSSTKLVSVRTWYDNLLTGIEIGFGVLTLGCAVMYVMSSKKKD